MDIALSCRARATARRHNIPEPAIVRARQSPVSSEEKPDLLLFTGELDDGTRILMRCSHDLPGLIVSIALG